MDPNFLSLFGAMLGISGSILLSIDALGAPEFLAAREAEMDRGFQMTALGFTATVNQIFVYLLFSVISAVVLLLISRANLVSLVVAPFVYYVWRIVVRLAEYLQDAIAKLGPKSDNGNTGCLSVLTRLIIAFMWAACYLIASLFYIGVGFLLDLPLRLISERFIKPRVEALYEFLAEKAQNEQRWHLKRNSLIGTILILFGFFYQFLGTLLQIRW